MKSLTILSLLAGLLIAAAATPALAVHPHHGYHAIRADVMARYYASQRPWHGQWAYTPWGMPTALVVPPNSKMHTSYAWGVGQSQMIPIYHQFFRDYPGELAVGGGAEIYATPYWPSHTDQFGVYPVRGPW
ncbi:MAG TPA: hypothetical protein VFB80_04255 [Pirellulaceae bacterium]|nr:hypothetical protein [Pirellulaceae bacterium]